MLEWFASYHCKALYKCEHTRMHSIRFELYIYIYYTYIFFSFSTDANANEVGQRKRVMERDRKRGRIILLFYFSMEHLHRACYYVWTETLILDEAHRHWHWLERGVKAASVYIGAFFIGDLVSYILFTTTMCACSLQLQSKCNIWHIYPYCIYNERGRKRLTWTRSPSISQESSRESSEQRSQQIIHLNNSILRKVWR